MDKRILTPEELAQLKQFIISRSARFSEPGILLEITDHFASKTEEILTEEKYISFEMAMKKAHHSFGVKGFSPIAEAYEQTIFNAYKKASKQFMHRMLFTIHFPGTLLIGLFFGFGFLFLNKLHLLRMDGFELLLLLQLIYCIAVYPKRVLFKKSKVFQFFYAKAIEANAATILWPWATLLIIPGLSYIGAAATAIVIGSLAFLFSFNLILVDRLMKKVKHDTEDLNQKLQLVP